MSTEKCEGCGRFATDFALVPLAVSFMPGDEPRYRCGECRVTGGSTPLADRQPTPSAPLPPPAYSVGSGDLRDGPQPVCSVCERPWPTGYDNCPSRNQSWHQNRATMRAHPFALVPDTDHCADCGRGRFAYCHQPEPSYLCNCGESFREHLARVAHMATCPTMQEGPR